MLDTIKTLIDNYLPRHSNAKLTASHKQRARLRTDLKTAKRVHAERIYDLMRHIRKIEDEAAGRYRHLVPAFGVSATKDYDVARNAQIHTIRWQIDPAKAAVMVSNHELQDGAFAYTLEAIEDRLIDFATTQVANDVRNELRKLHAAARN